MKIGQDIFDLPYEGNSLELFFKNQNVSHIFLNLNTTRNMTFQCLHSKYMLECLEEKNSDGFSVPPGP